MTKIRLSRSQDDLDLPMVCGFISGSYWGKDRRPEDIRKALAHSYCVSVHDGPRQVGFARAVSDQVYFGYIMDLFVLHSHRGQGLSHQLVDGLLQHPQLKDVKGWMLATIDAHGLYEKYGFRMVDPSVFMRRNGD